MDLSLEEMIQSQINQISTSEQLKDFIEQHSHDISAFCKALESQIAHAMHGQREAIMAFVLYYFGYMQNLDRIGKLIADGCVSFFVMDVCEPVCIGGKSLITKQQLANMVHVVAPYLEKVTEKESENALEFCIRYAFEIAKPYIAHLRQHEDYKIARQAIEAYRIHNCDEGTLDIIEQYYMRTGKSGFSDILSHWAAYRYEKPIQGYARQSQEDNGHHQKIAQVAFNILNHAFRFTDLTTNFLVQEEGSLYEPPNRVSANRLLLAMAVCPPQGAVDLVYDMLSCPALHTKYRMEALLYYVDFTGEIPEQRKELIDAYFSTDPAKRWPNRTLDVSKAYDLLNLTQRNLVTLEELLTAVRTGQLGQTLNAIQSWPNKQLYRDFIVSEMMIAMENVIKIIMVKSDDIYQEYLQNVVNTLLAFELTTSEKNALDKLLQQMITHFQTYFSVCHFLVANMNHYRVQIGLLNEIKDSSEMSPWDAMAIHWQQKQISWEIALQTLADAQVIHNLDYHFKRIQSNDFTDKFMRFTFNFYSILDYFKMDPDWQDDSGFGYDEFEELVCLLNQQVDIRQIFEGERSEYLYTDISAAVELGRDSHATYYFESQQQYFKFRLNYQHLNDQITTLVHTFNNLLQQLGRIERCYEINSEGWGRGRLFFVADRFKYPAMQQYLRLPSWEVV